MSYKLVIKHEAFIDIVEAYIYYENKQRDLGETFLNQLDLFYKGILENPFIFASKREPYLRHLLKDFLSL